MEKKYQIFARKYRPKLFSEVVGQNSIVQTLKNSLKYNKSAQAYLFSGPRGTGKTTLTRLFAKALNCSFLDKNFEPCNRCSSCKEITSSSSLDIIEIDGASNRGIDDIRQINETISYSPSNGKYKIYIIDEVHMLTKEAFNALLKTLEEPPPSIKFFFATTEMHKVLPTIISRCQRFDLKPIPQTEIISKLSEIANDQNREITNEALEIIAQLSEGSLRDAESILDQIFCFHENNISKEILHEIFGLIKNDYFIKLDQAFLSHDIKAALEITKSLYKEGKDFSFFIEQYIEHIRKKMHLSLNEKRENLIYTTDQCIKILDILIKSNNLLKNGFSKQSILDTTLIQIIQSKRTISLPSLVKKLFTLEEMIKTKSLLSESNKKDSNDDIVTSPQVKEIISTEKENIQKKVENPSHSSPLPPENSVDKKEEIVLKEVPFKIKEDKKISVSKKSKDQYDTILNFTAVELDGIIKKE